MDQYFSSQTLNTLMAKLNEWLAASGLSLEGGLWVWALVQLAVLAVVFGVARFITGQLAPFVEAKLAESEDKSRLERFLVLASSKLHYIVFLFSLWIAIAIMRAATWPSRSHFLSVVASLVTAWLVISFTSSLIRNKTLAKMIATIAWIIAALNIFGILDDAIVLLDSLAIVLGKVRVSALLVIKSLIICSLLIWAALALSRFAEERLAKVEDLTPSVQVLTGKILRIALLAVAVLTALNVVGIDLTALAVFSGALGLGIGFGLQKIVSNLISGIILLLDKSIKPGDVIEIQTVSGTKYGWVEHLGARYTSVRSRDGTDTLFPNEIFIASPVTNWSHGDRRIRQRLSIGVSYDADVEKAMELCKEAASEFDRILKSPAPVCLLIGFGESSIDLELRFWQANPEGGLRNLASQVYVSIWKKFKEEGVEIPFPQRDLHLRSTGDLKVTAGDPPSEPADKAA